MLKKLQLKDKYNHSQEVIIEYLKNGLKEGKQFFKSKYIARDLGMSPKEVGTNMKILSDECKDLLIEKWSYSKSTTWRVESAAIKTSFSISRLLFYRRYPKLKKLYIIYTF